MSAIVDKLQAVRRRINEATAAAGRPADSVRLLAVSKTKPLADVLAAAAAGQLAFGENYVQEGVAKAMATVDRALEWHFIGPLQSNKSRLVAEHFAWLHTIDRVRIAERLSEQRPPHLPPLQVCVQVNISDEDSKSGCRPDEASALCHAVARLPHLQLRGLMCIPAATETVLAQRADFARLRRLYEQLRQDGLALDTLSMGMTHDLEAAIAEGATLVRIGTAIFGERN
ncbi:MAG: YggS family pyridoxal phosphate-dependent enzyme [Dechloromonas sp.]|nr:YggS family pyridoxal phosphate-dependent enzyme [Dechloromonas sp.]